MPGLAEILDENTRLRDLNGLQEARIQEQGVQLQEQSVQLQKQAAELVKVQQVNALQDAKLEVLIEQNERLTKHFEFLDKKKALAVNERFLVSQNQVPLFEVKVKAPVRDEKTEEDDKNRPNTKVDKRKNRKHKGKGRRKVDELDFPKKIIKAAVSSSDCLKCGQSRKVLDPKITYRVGWEPGHYTMLEIHQEQCTCPNCPSEGVWTAPQPFLLLGAMCDDSLFTRVIVDRFADHLPFNRQAKRMTREGFPINSNVLSGWSKQGFSAIRLLVKALRLQVSSSDCLQTDDSGFPVQDGSDGKLANGRMWVFTNQSQAFFAFSRTKEGEHPAELLKSLDVSGSLVADGGSEYNLVVSELGLERGGCWAHMRRYFFDALLQHPEAQVALVAIRDVFMIEREIAKAAKKERLATRKERSKPVVDGFFDWVKAMTASTRPKSRLGRALTYARNQEARMRLFLTHSEIPIHNNLSELLLRGPIVGRKNWLFAGSEGGAEAAMGWFSLVASCMLQGIDPSVYLYDVFRRLPDHPSKWVHELTPLNWRLAVDAGDLVPMLPSEFG